MEDLTIREISNFIGCNISTLRIYLDRAEFSHIIRHNGILYGITGKDICKLRNIYTKNITKRPQLKINTRQKK